ncbi:hypothetical protein [Vibrio sp. 1CM23M]|uniref:hypothetical protein n=1 Tax=Vibrio sp. 1CM23M TaxID=2929164 RepID=UPI0020BF9D6F|nr:hypothetical protein [Vibrio sp. 1CM23M]MCK8072430.1 hypothetical protein [Vibrio sp. 1CM23M]
MNQNLIITSEVSIENKELQILKKALIASAIPIQGVHAYAMPYGQEGVASGQHLLPSNLKVNLKNRNSQYYQYCPFVLHNATANENFVSENLNDRYRVNLISVNNVEYVVESTVSSYPEVSAFIISPDNKNVLSKCTDVKYDSNENVYYILDGKVETILKTEISDFNEDYDLTNKILTLTINQTNYKEMFEIVEHDMSNKSYNLILEEDITLASSFTFLRNPFMKSKIKMDMNGNVLNGGYTLLFENFEVYLYNGGTRIANNVAAFSFINSEINTDTVQIGKLELTNSEFNINGNTIFNGRNALQSESILNLYNSQISATDDFQIHGRTNLSNSFISLNKSDLSISNSEITFNQSADTTIGYIDSSSVVNINNSNLTIQNSTGMGFELYGTWNSSNNSSIEVSNSKIENLIIGYGGELNINDTSLLKIKDKTQSSTIKEETGFKYLSGNAEIFNNGDCWDGDIFNNFDSTSNEVISKTDKSTNSSIWQCL